MQAIDICKSSEAAAKQLRAIAHPNDVHAVMGCRERQKRRDSSPQSRSRRFSPDKKSFQTRTSTPGPTNCKYCGLRHEPKKSACPALGKFCMLCKKKNSHFASQCRSRNNAVCELEEAEGDILALDDMRNSRI